MMMASFRRTLRARYTVVGAVSAVFILLPYIALHRSPGALHFIYQATLLSPNLNRIFGNAHTQLLISDRNLNLTQQEYGDLQKVLNKASFGNRTVIITTLNQAWASQNSMIDLFLESFRLGEETSLLMKHLVIVALDQVAYDRCITLHEHCFTLRTEGVDFSGEKHFMTDDYLKMMWRRIDFLRYVLELEYSFVFSDADVMWFRNPFPHFSKDADFEIACDNYYGNPTDLANKPNGGFVRVQASPRTVEFYRFWYQSRQDFPGKHDQDVLNIIKFTSSFMDIGLKMRFLSTEYFGGFCQVSKDLEKVCTMHANCCTGLTRKLQDLRLVLDDWKRFKTMTPYEKLFGSTYWRAPRGCLHSLHS